MITQLEIIHYNRTRNALSEGRRSQDSSYLSSFFSKLLFDILCLFGLVSTVTSLRGYWMFLDAFIFPERPVLTVLVPGLVGFVSLMTLKILSSLHGGIVTVPDVQQGILWPSWLLTYWLIKARGIFRINTKDKSFNFRRITSRIKTVIQIIHKRSTVCLMSERMYII